MCNFSILTCIFKKKSLSASKDIDLVQVTAKSPRSLLIAKITCFNVAKKNFFFAVNLSNSEVVIYLIRSNILNSSKSGIGS